MSESQNIFGQLSSALAAQSASISSSVAAIRLKWGRYLSATLWKNNAIITSEQSLPKQGEFIVERSDGSSHVMRCIGRDAGTNIAVLQSAQPIDADLPEAGRAIVGALACAYGADGAGGVRSRLGVIGAVGPAWHSMAGGLIDQRIALDIRLSQAEEGGPVLDAAGGLIGMSTLGARAEVLAIPAQTIDRVVAVLLRDGRMPSAWLGLAMQPVAVPDALQSVAGQRSAMMVMSALDGGPAATAGVIAGDILLTIDGTSARHLARGRSLLDAGRIGEEIELRLIRGGAVISVRAVIAARP